MKKIITLIILACLSTALFAAITTNTVSQDTYGVYTISDSADGVDVEIRSATYTDNVYVTCYSGQIYVDPNCILDKVTINGVSTSRVERVYLTISNAVKFTQSGFPKTFTIGCTNAAVNRYTITLD